MSEERKSCDCNHCKSACSFKPGWFMPGEIEKVAEYLNISITEVFDKYLSVDWYEKDGVDYFPISPSAKCNTPGDMWPYDPRGECIFFEEGKCKIHPVSPYECQQYHHSDSRLTSEIRHQSTGMSWEGYEKQVEILLGRKPFPPERPDSISILGL